MLVAVSNLWGYSRGMAENAAINTLCRHAKFDAEHDFDSEKAAAADSTLFYSNCGKVPKDENKFLEEIGFFRNHIGEFIQQEGHRIANYFMLTNIPIGGNFIAKLESDLGPVPKFLIVDTASEYFIDRLKKDHLPSQYFWLQTAQTLFDPAGKTRPYTPAGKTLFNGKIPNLIFAWEDNTNGIFYNKFMKPIAAPIPTNQLMFSKYSSVLTIDNNNKPNDYLSHEAKCMVDTGTGFFVGNKDMAKISGGNLAAGCYQALFGSLVSLIGSVFSTSTEPKQITYVDEHHAYLKRAGDGKQAIVSLSDSLINLKYLNMSTIQKINTSSGVKIFVTIDRLALAAALIYAYYSQTDIVVVFCYNDGSIGIFTSKGYLTPASRLANLKVVYRQAYKQYSVVIKDYNNKIVLLNSLKVSVDEIIRGILTQPITNEEQYRVFILLFFTIIKNIDLLSSVSKFIEDDRGALIPIESYSHNENIDALSDILAAQKAVDLIQNITNVLTNNVQLYKMATYPNPIDELSRDNIMLSKLFSSAERQSTRIFIGRREEYTLASYVRAIYEALSRYDRRYGSSFTSVFTDKIHELSYLIFSNGEEYYKVMAEYLIKSIASDRTASVRGGGKFRKHIKSAISRHITKFGKKTMKPTHIPYIIIKSFKEQYINEELSKLTLAIYIANYGNIKMECNGCVSGSLHKKIQKMVKVLSSLKYPNIPISKDDNPYYLDFVKDQLIYLITVDNNRIAEQLYQIIEGEFEDDTYYLDPSVLEIIDMYIKFITHKKSRKIKYTRSAVKTPRAKSRIPVSHTPSPSSSSELGEVRELIYAGGGSSKLRKTRRKRRN